MTDQTRIAIGRGMALVAVLGAIGGVFWVAALGLSELLLREWLIHNATIAVSFGVVTWLVLPSQPRNNAVWVGAWAAFFGGLYAVTMGALFSFAVSYGYSVDTIYSASPSDMPLGIAVFAMCTTWLFLPTLLPMSLGLIMFPDGRPPSSRWRWAIWLPIVAVVISAGGLMWQFRPTSTAPLGDFQASSDFLSSGGFVLLFGFALELVMISVGLVAMVIRYRRSVGAERQQFRWVLYGGAIAVSAIAYSVLQGLLTGEDPRWPFLVAVAALISSYGIAIARYRLYDVDVVISRTLVYGVLAVFIGVVYVAIAVVPWVILGSEADNNAALGIVATVIVAVSFQPLRRRLERVANRIVYGRRATPYEVLSSFSQSVAVVDPDVLGRIAQSLTEGTTATSASISVDRDGGLHQIASWPAEPLQGSAGDVVEQISHDGERMGAISLELPPGQPFPPNDAELLTQVASGLGLALRNLQLTDDLQTRVDQLRESRRRVVAVQDQTRQMLERDLHDGAQQRLVALKIKVGLGGAMAKTQGLGDVTQILDTVKDETDLTIESLRNLARGIYPPLLEAEGLGAALTAQLRRAPIPVTVQAAGIGRHPRELEATVYFCVLEAVNNSIKHSQARSVLVALGDDETELRFEVRDDGVGFDMGTVSGGHGLTNINDRLDSVGGSLEVVSTLDHGTVVVGRIPTRQEALL